MFLVKEGATKEVESNGIHAYFSARSSNMSITFAKEEIRRQETGISEQMRKPC